MELVVVKEIRLKIIEGINVIKKFKLKLIKEYQEGKDRNLNMLEIIWKPPKVCKEFEEVVVRYKDVCMKHDYDLGFTEAVVHRI